MELNENIPMLATPHSVMPIYRKWYHTKRVFSLLFVIVFWIENRLSLDAMQHDGKRDEPQTDKYGYNYA